MMTMSDINATRGDACIAQYKVACTITSPQQRRMTWYKLTIPHHSPGWPVDPDGDVARFLLVRGPYAFLGTGWQGCVEGWFKLPKYNETYIRPASFDVDYGSPVDQVCIE